MADEKPIVLVVEDDPRLLRVYQAKLGQQGWTVLTAADGEVGSQLAIEKHPQVVLLDLMLPKKDGFGVLSDLKNDLGSANVKVLILSNLGQQADIDRGKTLGAKEYMVKSDFSLDAIIAKVKAYLPAGA
ncbi:response regulator transcription factor [Candidatus Uhrbacteria bacterium]|nr:response regulator transcription factor [Candidatus Uhrbacteria bacterium]